MTHYCIMGQKMSQNRKNMHYPHLESSTLEWKKEIPRNDQIIKTVIGFCNQCGGKLVIGVANSGDIVGVPECVIQESLEFLEKAIYEASHPAILPRIYTQRFGEKMLLIIEVTSGMNKPYFRKSEGMEKGTYIRLGRSTLKATGEIINELQWQSKGLNYETLPSYRSEMADLDEKKAQSYLDHRKNQGRAKLNKSVLQSYHLLIEEHSKSYPTNLGLLLFGKRTQHFFSEAMIICSEFRGKSGRDAIASVDCEGTLFEQFEKSVSFIVSRLSKSFVIRKIKREEQLEIPEVAIREALLNAIVHRNYYIQAPTKIAIYNDRIEFFSPGTLPGPLNLENLMAGITYLRNPMICKIFREAGYIEKLGTGLISIFSSYQEFGLEEPKFIEGENFVKMILPRTLQKKRRKTTDDLIKSLFVYSNVISIEDIQKVLKVSRQTAVRKMNVLIDKGRVTRIGKTRSVRYKLQD